MKNKKCYCGIITAAVSISLFLAGTLQAVPDNGTFDTDLGYWTASPGVSWAESEGDGVARFGENFDAMSSLYQDFTIPDGAQNLTFNRVWNSVGSGTPNSDTFTVSLRNPGNNELITTLYYINTEGNVAVNDNVILDVSSFANKYVRLTFGLYSDSTDRFTTTVDLDDVKVTVVPAPGAMLLAAIGAGFVGWLRKSGKLR